MVSNRSPKSVIGVRVSAFLPYFGVLAQLVAALACQAKGQGFETPTPRHFF